MDFQLEIPGVGPERRNAVPSRVAGLKNAGPDAHQPTGLPGGLGALSD
jgi:hypothetical protein